MHKNILLKENTAKSCKGVTVWLQTIYNYINNLYNCATDIITICRQFWCDTQLSARLQRKEFQNHLCRR